MRIGKTLDSISVRERPLQRSSAVWLAVLALTFAAAPAVLAQTETAVSPPAQVSGSVSLSSKGISTVPALTLGRPAAVFDLAVRKRRMGFEPQFRFDLHGEPWSFLLWGRYRLGRGRTFGLTLGAHPAFSFKSTTMESDGHGRAVIEVRRYLAGEIAPVWTVGRRTTAGAYYLYSKGLDFGAVPHTHLIAARMSLSKIPIARQMVAQLSPQAYFLRTNGKNGTYANVSATIELMEVPVALGATVNVPLRTEVAGGRDVLWNVSLTYTFR